MAMGAEWNHHDKEVHNPSKAATLGIDTWMQEHKRGNCYLTCRCCHEIVTARQWAFEQGVLDLVKLRSGFNLHAILHYHT